MPQVPRPRTSASAEPDSATLAHVARWQEQTLRGNLALEACSYGETRRRYEEALVVAEELLEEALLGNRDAGRCGLLLFGTSCNNIAELARQQRDVQTEGIFLYRAVERFITVAKSARAPLRFRVRCLLHLKVASDALYRYFEGRGMWDAAASYSNDANAAMFEVRSLEAAARRRAILARGAARRWSPDSHAPTRPIRIDVAGSSPRDASSRDGWPRLEVGGDGHEDVLRVLESLSADEHADRAEAHAGFAGETSSDALQTRSG
jgi:hypothetical protein